MSGSRQATLAEASTLAAQGDLPAARRLCQESLIANPEHAEALQILGVISASEGDFGSAASYLSRALVREPARTAWRRDLAAIYAAAGQWSAAAHAFATSIHGSTDASIWLAYARSLLETGQLQASEDAIDAANSLEPGSAEAHELKAHLCNRLRRYEEELDHRKNAMACGSQSYSAFAFTRTAHANTGDIEGATHYLRQAVALNPECRDTHSALLSALLYEPHLSPAMVRDEHKLWARSHCQPTAMYPHCANAPEPDRKLRIGYVSGESTSAPSFHFLIPIFRNHDPERFETFYYQAHSANNECTATYRKTLANWRDVSKQPDSQVAETIRRDGIDILVDTGGHYGRHVLPVFALRPAPIQVNYPNFPCTTGIAQIDYIFTDGWTCPPGAESQYAEQAWRLPSGYLVYDPLPAAPPVTPLPALKNGHVTFGIFQRAAKLNSRVWDAAAQVLRRVPDSRLLVHFSSADLDIEGNRARTRIESALESRGVSSGRVRFRGALNPTDHIACLAEADIALDSFPYNGQTTTCECVWMGVPVVTRAEEVHVARVGAGLLTRIGMADWVAESSEEYVEIAVRAAADLSALAALRAGLRERMAVSSLVDGRRIAIEIEDAYRSMWRRWCSAQKETDSCQAAATRS